MFKRPTLFPASLEWSDEKKRLMISQCLRGEMRVPKASTASNLASAGILARLSKALNLKGEEEVQVSPCRGYCRVLSRFDIRDDDS